MLSKKENAVMTVLAKECKNKDALLITPIDLKGFLTEENISTQNLDKIISDLYMDGYFDLVLSDRHGEKVYCITLTERGKGYLRNKKILKRNILFRLCLSAALALFSFIIGLILKAVF